MEKTKYTANKNSISYMISSTLQKIFALILGVSILIALSLFLFTRYTGVVNSAGIVRGGSQRAVKLVLANETETANAAIGVVDTNLDKIKKQMHLGAFPKSRNEVDDFWDGTIKTDIEEYRNTGDMTQLISDSETFFQMTNKMVNDAQVMVNILSIILYIILIAFVAVCFVTFRKVSKIFAGRVVDPIADLETSLINLSNGQLSDEFVYSKDDEIGTLYNILNQMREGILSYVTDIDKNINVMAGGDLVSSSDMTYLGDYAPIQNNINYIRSTLSDEFRSMDDMADHVAASAEEVAKVSQALAEGAVNQTNSIQDLQEKIQVTLDENKKVDVFVEEVLKSSNNTVRSVEASRAQMDKAVSAMADISKASEEIANIVKALDGITSETSLLSLNASIEAARAGEAGKGFAIVAENVGKLADESSKSTESITSLIENALESILRGTEIVNVAAESLNDITANTNDVDDIIAKLDEQSKAQNERMEEIDGLSKEILDVVTDNSAVSQECAASSAELTTFSGNLKDSVAKFRTE
ncbi:MAG: HAMP domain-containing protein [Pseudobutyrivibrio sp.]|nr:HAMP domain-containing protein [Pseudobutyrivibrio sp.]